MKKSTVALVGRPNTGKSTLFNKIVGKRLAIVLDTKGVTRDRLYANASYKEKEFYVIDTGGIELNDAPFSDEIKMQAELAVDEAEVVLFVVDAIDGLTEDDKIIGDILRKSKKPVVVVVNKIDNKKSEENKFDFYELGFDHLVNVSAEHSQNISELLDIVFPYLKNAEKEVDPDKIKFCLLGRPNVGKSSLVNALAGKESTIVSSEAGTTRDAIEVSIKHEGRELVAVDTAGIRKRGKVYEKIEKYSVIRAMKALDEADVALILIDAEDGIKAQDKHIAGYAIEAGVGLVLVVNKWDKIENKDTAIKDFEALMRAEFQFLTYVPIVYLSALTTKRVHTLIPEIMKVYNNNHREIKTSLLNDVIYEATGLNPPATHKGKKAKFYYSYQINSAPPKFLLQVNDESLIHFAYKRYLENQLRANFDFEGTPITLIFKNKSDVF